VWRIFLIHFAGCITAAAQDFAADLYPVFEKAQCRLCHNDNGVAAGTRLQFPREGASAAEVLEFGLDLQALVDRANPERSLLFLKPTNRLAHTGGERIKPGGTQEAALRAWVRHLAASPVRTARKRPDVKLPVTVRRLTHSQYNNTVRDLIGDNSRPADQFPKEDFVHGYTNQADGQGISPLQAEAYSRAAERIARNAFRGGDGRSLVLCRPSSAEDTACAAKFVRQFGGRAFRRPLNDAEAGRYVALWREEAGRTRNFYEGTRLVAEAMLQSPHFLFHLEDPAGYRVASRLSYFLWDTMPDEWLFAEAAAGRLASPEQIRRAVERLLGDARARMAMDEFLAQWLRADRLRGAVRDLRRFPEFSLELAGAMWEETRRLFGHLIWNDGDFREFFSAGYGFLPASLAKLYGVQAPAEEFGRIEFPEASGRAGIVGQATFLTLTSKPADTSPTERGLFVREHFLCQQVPPPPPGVDTTLPALTDERPLSTRERLAVHLSNPACAGCHKLVDNIGFGLEKYDAIGRYRQKEVITILPTADEIKRKAKTKPSVYELPIEAEGYIHGVPSSSFTSPRELGQKLAGNALCQRCVVKQLFRYAAGRQETEADQLVIDEVLSRFRDSNFRFRELIIGIASSRSFLGEDERR
jgi:hypothetical protein